MTEKPIDGQSEAVSIQPKPAAARVGLRQKLAYGWRSVPSFAWQRASRRLPKGKVHLVIAVADHFEPAIVPGHGIARAPYADQEARVERWCREYPKAAERWRDADGRPFVHTYFYPAEQYDRGHISRLAEHCRAGWGEIEIHLHHGIPLPDTAANLRQTLVSFRDKLALEHCCLSRAESDVSPRFCFVHGNFALANSAGGFGCGVDEELQILGEEGCVADFTFPANPFNPAQRAMINSLYECRPALTQRAAFRSGTSLERGRSVNKFPFIVQGPLALSFSSGGARRIRVDNGSFTAANPPSLERLQLWKRAMITVQGRPDWLFIKLHCHGMDPEQEDAVMGASFTSFIRSLVEGADERGEILHFVTAREMVNVILAACDGKEGDPGDYRDYRFKPWKPLERVNATEVLASQTEGKP
jgi:hypothetical protein